MNSTQALIALRKGYKLRERSFNSERGYIYLNDDGIWVVNGHRHVLHHISCLDNCEIDWEIYNN
jgi:hypothetical protein